MKALFDEVSVKCSRLTTKSYSTSFSLGIRFLGKRFRDPIYAIYGFVRFADEIVDTFHEYDKKTLLDRFRQDTYLAIEEGISLNPILNSFQDVVHNYNIPMELIDTFLDSMEMDLTEQEYDQEGFEKYILGSAEVVGLMCLCVFLEGDMAKYKRLEYYAMRLGSAFQKINFLRDLHADYRELGRAYFPGLEVECFDAETKAKIEADIEQDFHDGFTGIKMLPKDSRFGVYVAYMYYYRLFRKIRGLPHDRILEERVRIPNQRKYAIFVGSYFRHQFNII
ncbi:MAG: phytoene/squalene synthase family protein [Bacteroidota bacterium]